MPVLSVIAGPNGSGKTTLIHTLVQGGVLLGQYLNADDIARDLIGTPQATAAEAQQIVRDRREAAFLAYRDHAFETVMSHPSHIDYMRRARSAGFEVRLYFVATEDPVINLGRVTNRVAHGGHDVPADRLIARYYRCLGNLPAAIAASDKADIFDNSSFDQALRHLATIGAMHNLVHTPASRERSSSLPVWWLEILKLVKPDNPLENGPIDRNLS